MKFMLTWDVPPNNTPDAVYRFLATGGPAPRGVKVLGRWHGPRNGFALIECKDGKALAEWMVQWSDLLVFNVYPVLEDRDAGAVFRRVYKNRK